ncbi:DUF2244 domain-containing protein [Rubellimicrobium aerolatum]|uniref:DUF2244 domain-containing protein n=1 Tax=Rubellimicrobium aerolatum TaxID=490979 RepID=A0ABW0SB31_9RHOB|nr:DUF2244 domain-containing protein [Rubellimicrobium aerolatum]MBP1805416.1 putative membrane protein [Rubellimicrobium aerolatum]
MPYQWTDPTPTEGTPRPVAQLRLWPHRSLPRRGFAAFFGVSGALAALPLLTMLGSPVLWGLLPFVLLTFTALWFALQLTYRSGEVREELRLWPDRILLTRHDPRRPPRRWEANPHWVRAALHETGGPVPNYLTLSGSGRTVEIGAFLSEDERLILKPELENALRRLR